MVGNDVRGASASVFVETDAGMAMNGAPFGILFDSDLRQSDNWDNDLLENLVS